MTIQEKTYPYDRVLMLNAMDDLFSALRAVILSSQTACGGADVLVQLRDGGRYRFCLRGENGGVRLRIETADLPAHLDAESRAVGALFEKIDSLLAEGIAKG